MTRFNNHNDRGKPGRGRIDAEDGMFMVKSLQLAKKLGSDFIMLHQWNDFEESAFIEPAWDFDGFNGDPYRYCKIVAASMNKTFTPAPLPAREQVDPYVRHKLYGDTQPGDMGPIARNMQLKNNTLTWQWSTGSGDPKAMHIAQQSLCTWDVSQPAGVGMPIQLGNLSMMDDGTLTLKNKAEARFYLPGMVMDQPQTVWLGIEVDLGENTDLRVEYQSIHKVYRVDSRWDTRNAMLRSQPSIAMGTGTRLYWLPLYGAQFAGAEGDLLLTLKKQCKATQIKRLMLWHPTLSDQTLPVNGSIQQLALPDAVDAAKPMVIVPVDGVGNCGYPCPVVDGKMLPWSGVEPMTVLLPDVIPASE
jgi:hypothetical protein